MNNSTAYIPPAYQAQAWADTYSTQPFAPDFETRRQAFFAQVLRNPAPPRPSKRAIFELARLAAGGQPDEGLIHNSLIEMVETRQDCADFVMQAVIRSLYQFGETPADPRIQFSPALIAHAKAATLGFKYWPDEPGSDSMCSWTENHQILFATAAYLAGQLYPEERFTNSGRTGRELMVIHRPRIERWLEMRFKSGFSEWLSNVYYDEDWAPLLNLVDFAADEELRQRARMIIDLSLFDLALNSFQGIFGSSHGRSYAQNKKWAALEGTTDTAKLLFGTGAFSAYDNMSVVLFALSQNYRLPPVLFEIAHDPAVLENRQRMGHRVQEARQWGLTYDDLESGMVFLSNEAYLHPLTANLMVKLFDAFNWWENGFFQEFKPYRKFLYGMRRLKLLPGLARLLEKDVCRNMRDAPDIYTYRTPDYMLSTAQDHRAGFGGDQHHIWQATLGPDAVCFTTHPANYTPSEPTPSYWSGSGSLPRVTQVKNVVIAIYKVNRMPGLYLTNRLCFTHAWLPKDRFDAIVERSGWIFARKGDGYLALRSQHPYRWQDQPGEDQGRDVIAEGSHQVWVCELGRREEDGAFETFIERITQAEITFGHLQVRYHSPSQGVLEFGWQGPLLQDRQALTIHNYPRYDNPYCQAPFHPEEIRIQAAGHALDLNWKTGKRQIT